MKEQEIAGIIHTYFLRLKKHFRSIEKDMTENTIKPFRIEIKKLRAFLRVLELEVKDPDDLKLHGHLKEMHKSGGRFRDLRLHRQRVEETAKRNRVNMHDIDALLKENIKQANKEQKLFFSNKEFPKQERKIKKHLPDSYDKDTIRRFFTEKKEAILDIIRKGTYSDKEMHDIRKKLKDILYIIKLYRVDIKTPLGIRFWNKNELLKAKELEDQLGFLNDTRNAMLLVEDAGTLKLNTGEKKILQLLRKRLLAKKRKLRSQVLLSLKKLYPVTG